MLGGIIGDLAASTYLRNPDIFYKQLFDDEATLSEYGLSILATYDFLKTNPRALKECHPGCADFVNNYFESADFDLVTLSDMAMVWMHDGAIPLKPTTSGMMLNRLATFYQLSTEANNLGSNVMIDHGIEKEDFYANIILCEIIRMLRNGYSKKEVLANVNPVFIQAIKSWNWKEQSGSLSLLCRAWICFYNSFDFGSAIHNAVRYPNCFTRQIASLTGLLAESMYGSDFYFKKKKYCANDESHISLRLPERLYKKYDSVFKPPYPFDSWKNRAFFPKNSAATNVERHIFTPYNSKLNGLILLPGSREMILRAFRTDWDNRYGFYLDDGWVYCYRSFYLLGRFKLIEKEGRHVIADVQQSDEMPVAMNLNIDKCIACALYSAKVTEAPKWEEL